MIKRNTLVELFGRNSIVVFVTHFTAVKFISSATSNVFEKFSIDSLVPFVTFGIAVCIEIIIMYICARFSRRKEQL